MNKDAFQALLEAWPGPRALPVRGRRTPRPLLHADQGLPAELRRLQAVCRRRAGPAGGAGTGAGRMSQRGRLLPMAPATLLPIAVMGCAHRSAPPSWNAVVGPDAETLWATSVPVQAVDDLLASGLVADCRARLAATPGAASCTLEVGDCLQVVLGRDQGEAVLFLRTADCRSAWPATPAWSLPSPPGP
jgi:hypothetical protein